MIHDSLQLNQNGNNLFVDKHEEASFQNAVDYKLLSWQMPEIYELCEWNSIIRNVWETTTVWLTIKIGQNWNLTFIETGMCPKMALSSSKIRH